MSKLELKHIAPYLPYGLKVKTTNEVSKDKIHTPKFIDAELEMIYLKEIPFKINQPLRECHLPYIKPILRPMSDLYREIDGSVGIVELAKMCEYPYSTAKWEIEENKCVAETDTFIYEFWIEDYIPFVTEYAKNIFGKVLNETTTQAFSPMMLLEYLFANHYDVFGLIEKGLAIDKNTIE